MSHAEEVEETGDAKDAHVLGHLRDLQGLDEINLQEDVPNEEDELHEEDAPPEVENLSEAEGHPRQPDDSKAEIACIVALIERMQATRPEMLRAAPAHQVVGCFGRVFWASKRTNFYHLSRVTAHFDEFLSHSWQVSSWKKALLLLILKNGMPALVCGTVGALLMMVVWQFGILPGFIKHNLSFSCWCSAVGLPVGALTIMFWRPKGLMFVDRMCINQFDVRMKAEGILNIGAVLSSSKSFLVMFDESYAERLWCVFELSAFLKAQQGRVGDKLPNVQIKPLLLGLVAGSVVVCVLALGVFAVFNPFDNVIVMWSMLLLFVLAEGIFVVHAFRRYFRSLEHTLQQLRDFQLQNAFCWCCSVNHINPANGQPVPVCDREIVRQCVTSWFGAEDKFNESVRSLLPQALMQQLGADAFPYKWILGSTAPIWWPFIDYLATYQASEEMHVLVPFFAIRFFAYWLFAVPMVGTVGIFFARCFHAKASSRRADILKDLLVLALSLPAALAFVAWELFTGFFFVGSETTLGAIVFAVGMFVSFCIVRSAYFCSSRRYFRSLIVAERS